MLLQRSLFLPIQGELSLLLTQWILLVVVKNTRLLLFVTVTVSRILLIQTW